LAATVKVAGLYAEPWSQTSFAAGDVLLSLDLLHPAVKEIRPIDAKSMIAVALIIVFMTNIFKNYNIKQLIDK